MWRLYHYTLCPFSRKARIALAEKRVAFELAHEKPWERRQAFLALNPAGMVPVLYDTESRQALADSTAIVEFLDESLATDPLIGASPEARAETRRLVAWFDIKCYQEVTSLLFDERVWKRFIVKSAASTAATRAALYNIRAHLDYIAYLCDRRRWLAGDHFSAADIAAAAQISVIDYLGGIDWDSAGGARDWYMRVKSRPSFRPLLADRLAGVTPAPVYEKLDF